MTHSFPTRRSSDLSQLQASPSVKRGIWQTIQIIKEIESIMGHAPTNIFIEFARDDGVKERTSSREKQLKICYEKLKEEIGEFNKNLLKELNNKDYAKRLNEEKMFLYFLQNGKCMYSGEALDIENLSNYQVDHIMPQAYIKDDSIDNKVLVKGIENQYKADNLLIDSRIRNARRGMWTHLHKVGMISNKKYFNLLKETITENEADRKSVV